MSFKKKKGLFLSFRSMLYNGSEVIRDLEWVIFDEVHYINDAEVRDAPDSCLHLSLIGFPC